MDARSDEAALPTPAHRKARLERMIEWLRQHEAQIAALDKVEIVFDCAGFRSFRAVIKQGELVTV